MGTPSPYQHWFDTSTGMAPVTEQNRTDFFVTGDEAFADIADRLEVDGGADASAYVLGWSCDVTTVMRPPSPAGQSLGDLLTYFAKQGGSVLAMLWDNSIMKAAAGCTTAVAFINALPGGGSHAILDHRTPLAGGHHQKIQIIVPSHKSVDVDAGQPVPAVAYCGGMDLFKDRVGPDSLHDVHCKLRGPVVDQLLRVFQDRWNDHPDRSGPQGTRVSTAPANGNSLVQLCLTYPTFQSPLLYSALVNRYLTAIAAALRHTTAPTAGDMRVNGSVQYYGFYPATQGIQQVWRAVKHAIAEATSFIYLEDQYLTFRWIGDALAAKLKAEKSNPAFRIVILACHPKVADIEQMWPRRRDLLAGLIAQDPQRTRWTVVNRRLDRPHYYVHSKTWIFDDELVITGSANVDRRGYTYNSEADVVVAGDAPAGADLTPGATTVAQDLRARLFAKHLGGKPQDYLKPGPALQLFFGRLGRTNVQRFDPGAEIGAPDSHVAQLQSAGPMVQAALTWMGVRPEDWLWDYIEDPDPAVLAP